jgi:hypothetical protein
MSVDASQLEALLTDLERAQAALPGQIQGRTIRAMRDLLRVARSVVHIQSGRLRDSLYIVQPSALGAFTESSIQSIGVSYAAREADKGGEHDYPARTIAEGQAIIDQLADDLADLLAQATGAGRG